MNCDTSTSALSSIPLAIVQVTLLQWLLIPQNLIYSWRNI